MILKSKRKSAVFIVCIIISGILLWIIVHAIYVSHLAVKVDALKSEVLPCHMMNSAVALLT